jgi:hypothetical protein
VGSVSTVFSFVGTAALVLGIDVSDTDVDGRVDTTAGVVGVTRGVVGVVGVVRGVVGVTRGVVVRGTSVAAT